MGESSNDDRHLGGGEGNIHRLVFRQKLPIGSMTRRRREILISVHKSQIPPGESEQDCYQYSPRFGNRSSGYSRNDTETPKNFILQLPRGTSGDC